MKRIEILQVAEDIFAVSKAKNKVIQEYLFNFEPCPYEVSASGELVVVRGLYEVEQFEVVKGFDVSVKTSLQNEHFVSNIVR